MFLEGLESTAHQVEDQGKFMTKKQVIFVLESKFEFTQYDEIFKLKGTPHADLAQHLKDGKKFKVVKLQGKGCFCCKKELTSKVKQDVCHFCSAQGCIDCVYKDFPFPSPDESGNF